MFIPIDSHRFAIQIVMVAGILSSHQVEAPKLRCDKDTEYPHRDKCCRLCPPGTHFVTSCEQSHGISTCEKCPPNTFAEVDNHLRECYRCSNPCNEQWGEVQFSNCTNYHDRECRCKKGMHRDGEVCKRHTPCPPGQGVIRKGSHRSDTRCQPCPPGTFSKRSSIFEKCKPWTNCAEEGLKTREEGNASRDAKCGGRLQPQQATPTPTSGLTHNTSATPPMDTPTSSATVPQSSRHKEAATSAATVTPASTTLGSVAVTSTPTTSQSASATSSQSTSKQPGSGESTSTAENSPNEERDPGPNNQPAIAVKDLATIIISVLILVMLIIGFIVLWCKNKKNEEQENTANANGPLIGDNLPDHEKQPDVPDQGRDLNPQDLQERQALLPRMEQGEGELEPDAMEQARGGENQQGVQIVVPTNTGTPGGQQVNLGLYQDQRCVSYDARHQTVQFQIHNATVHHHFGSPEFVQIGASNTINQSPSTAGATNPESTNSDASDSEHGE